MSEYEQAVFISYAWGGEREEVVNDIDQALQKRGLKIIRDKRDLGYKGSITEFMERIGRGNCVIVVISDKYLRSPNCMFELVEIADGKQFHERIFPVVLSDANIYDPLRRIEYIKFWEAKIAELDMAMREVGMANLQGIRDDIDQYTRIRARIADLTDILKDMNTLTPDMHRDANFEEVYEGILKRMQETADKSTESSAKPITKKERKPMDPITLAATATSLLAPFLKKAGEAALDKLAEQAPGAIGKIWETISRRSEKATSAAKELASDTDPENEELLAQQLQTALQLALKKDQEFASLLTDLVERAKDESGNTGSGDQITTTASNNSTAVGKISVGGNVSGNFIVGNNNQVNNK